MISQTNQTELFTEYPEQVIYESLLEVWFALINKSIDPFSILLTPEAKAEFDRVEWHQKWQQSLINRV